MIRSQMLWIKRENKFYLIVLVFVLSHRCHLYHLYALYNVVFVSVKFSSLYKANDGEWLGLEAFFGWMEAAVICWWWHFVTRQGSGSVCVTCFLTSFVPQTSHLLPFPFFPANIAKVLMKDFIIQTLTLV